MSEPDLDPVSAGASPAAEAVTTRRGSPLARVLYALAFLSGSAALTYEVAWAKLLSLTFGSTTLAASAVVGGFLGGMGIGAWLYHRVQGRVASPLRTYASIEIGIALAAAALTAGLPHLPAAFASLSGGIPSGPPMTLFRVVSVLLLLLVPAALMGATYPALCTCLIGTREEVDRHLGMLYGVNTLGAAAGALVAGLFLVPAFGLAASVAVGNALNLLVGISAFALSRGSTGDAIAPTATAAQRTIPTELPHRLTGAVILLSGFATLSYEILWFRALRYLVGNSTFALTIVLVVFLLGLGFGALPLRRVVARGRPELDLARCQFGIALLAALAIGVMMLMLSRPDLNATLSVFSLAFRTLPWEQRLLVHGALALALMLPATLLMGLSFPLASRLFIGDVRLLGRRVGGAYLLSNLGSILGAILAAAWLLPRLGTVGGTHLVIGVNFLLGLALLLRLRLSVGRRLAEAGGVLVAVVALLLVFPERTTFQGGFRLPGVALAFEEENDLGTVEVLQDSARPELKGISIDGTFIGASSGWYPSIYSKQLLIAHLPMLLDARLRSALQIGLGSASTLDALASHPGLERIDCVEINPAVVRGSRLFEESAVYRDPRVRVVVEDALHFLVRGGEPYDLIVSDGKQNEDFSGNAKLLSRDFYALARSRLSPRGLFVQWISSNYLHADFRIILRTIAEVFPELAVFIDPPGSMILVASLEPLEARPRISREAFEKGRISRDLRRLGIPGPEHFLRRWMADREPLLEAAGPGPLNTWDQAILEFAPYRASPREQARASADNLRLLIRAHGLADARAPGRVYRPRPPQRTDDANAAPGLPQIRWRGISPRRAAWRGRSGDEPRRSPGAPHRALLELPAPEDSSEDAGALARISHQLADDVAEGAELSGLEVGDLHLERGTPGGRGTGEVGGGLLLEAGGELGVVGGDVGRLVWIGAKIEELHLCRLPPRLRTRSGGRGPG